MKFAYQFCVLRSKYQLMLSKNTKLIKEFLNGCSCQLQVTRGKKEAEPWLVLILFVATALILGV